MLDRPEKSTEGRSSLAKSQSRRPSQRLTQQAERCFLQALADDLEAHGKGVVEKVCTERPQDYLKIVASVMPSEWKSRMLVYCSGKLIYPKTSCSHHS